MGVTDEVRGRGLRHCVEELRKPTLASRARFKPDTNRI
jgi:hypothetical protein